MDPLHGLPPAPAWGQWTGLFGRSAIIAGVALFALAAVLWIVQKPKLARVSFYTAVASLFGAFASLLALFVGDQFQYEYVFGHSEAKAALIYKIAGIWTGQEGSFILWAITTAFFGALALRATKIYERWYGVMTAGFLSVLCAILAYESPFGLMKEAMQNGQSFVPPTGAGIPPTLFNYWVIIHPPTIFLGFGALIVPFSMACAAMLERNAKDWAPIVRPWTLAGMAILGLGVCMGGLWAYETLGWGGFWAWDPVENASFVPWLFLAALAHGLIVQITKGRMTGANLILGGLGFISFVYGTFLTRSGLLDDVSNHSFASMDRSALVILRFVLIALSAGFLGLYLWRGRALVSAAQPDTDEGMRREAFYRFGTLMLFLLGVVVALGMSWPVVTALRSGSGKRVEEILYHRVIIWFFVPAMLAMAVAPFVTWRTMSRRELIMRVANVFSLSLFITGMVLVALQGPDWGLAGSWNEMMNAPVGNGKLPAVPVVALLLLLCSFVAVSGLWRAIESARRANSSLGAFVAHFGFAVLIGGLIVSRGLERKEEIFVQAGNPGTTSLGYTLTFKDFSKPDMSDKDNKAIFEVTARDGSTFEARPGLYSVEQGGQPDWQVWPHIQRFAFHDVYFALHKPVTDIWEKPASFKPGETRLEGKVTVTYLKFLQEGTPGTPGAKFGGLFRFKVQERDGEPEKSYDAMPMMALTENGVQPEMAQVGPHLFAMMGRMDAATKAIDLRLMLQQPMYPVEIYTKPLTGLVWLGTGILSLGGFMAAFARRSRAARTSQAEAPETFPIEPDAPLPAPKSETPPRARQLRES
ncbi:hypothetical protein EON79_02850 [bacterium]|nr:MAG: hypothetical protein EON79_02850 [bacterium]